MSHLTYVQAIVTGIVQGVTELFPISSLGHNVLIPALIGGSWAKNLSVTAKDSPYLAFIVGLHVATALAMIIFFRRDWIRIIRGFFSSVRARRIETPDERLAWMIIFATIPVGIAGLLLQKVFTTVFARPTLTAFFLAVNGAILLYSERQRRRRLAVSAGPEDYGWDDGAGYRDESYDTRGYRDQGYSDAYGRDGHGVEPGRRGAPDPGPGRRGRPAGGYSQQPQQQQWQGPGRPDPDPYGERPQPRFEPKPGYQAPGYGQPPAGGQQPGGQQPGGGQAPGGQDPRYGQAPGHGQPPRGQDPRYGQAPGQPPAGGPSFTPNPGYQQPPQSDPRYTRDPRQDPAYGQDPRYGQQAGPGQGGDATEVWDQRGSRRGPRDPELVDADPAVEADQRLSTMSFKRAAFIGAGQILALLPGISRDGIVTVFGMGRGLNREDAVRFSFLLSAPVILLAGMLKVKDLFGPMGNGILGPVLVGSVLAFIGAYVSVRFLTRYFSESKSLNPFGIYCIVAGLLSLAYLTIRLSGTEPHPQAVACRACCRLIRASRTWRGCTTTCSAARTTSRPTVSWRSACSGWTRGCASSPSPTAASSPRRYGGQRRPGSRSSWIWGLACRPHQPSTRPSAR